MYKHLIMFKIYSYKNSIGLFSFMRIFVFTLLDNCIFLSNINGKLFETREKREKMSIVSSVFQATNNKWENLNNNMLYFGSSKKNKEKQFFGHKHTIYRETVLYISTKMLQIVLINYFLTLHLIIALVFGIFISPI